MSSSPRVSESRQDTWTEVLGGWEANGSPPGYGTQMVDSAIEESRRYLRRRSQLFEAAGIKAAVTVAVGDPVREIVNRATASGADMIAMTTRREHLLEPGVLGSVVDGVLRSTPVPLLTVHPRGQSSPLPKLGKPCLIVVPLDGSEPSEAAVPVALELADTVGAEARFIRVLSPLYAGPSGLGLGYYPSRYTLDVERGPAIQYLKEFVVRARGAGVKSSLQVVKGRAASRIVEAVEKEPGALIVMSTHGVSGFRRWAIGSVTGEVVRTSGHPVLVVPPHTHGLHNGHSSSHKQAKRPANACPAPEDERSRAEKEERRQPGR